MTLRLVSGGAAQGLVAALRSEIEQATGLPLEGSFGAVGTMAGKLRAGEPFDLAILTPAALAELARDGLIEPSSFADVGRAATAIAVRTGDPPPPVGDADALRAALLASDAVYLPDIAASTAGIHAIGVIERLGIRDALADRLRIFPNGATAMRELAASTAARPIGCTQTTEIVPTEGVALVAPLPKGLDLTTLYRAAIVVRSAQREAAARTIAILTAPEHAALRARLGFS